MLASYRSLLEACNLFTEQNQRKKAYLDIPNAARAFRPNTKKDNRNSASSHGSLVRHWSTFPALSFEFSASQAGRGAADRSERDWTLTRTIN